LPPVSAKRPHVVLIAAVAANGTIGLNNRLPWHIPGDLQRFKALTLGHAVVMGRRTFESIGRPLPGRENIVVTRSTQFAAPGCRVAHSLEEALAAAGDADQAFVIGGADLYREALPLAERLLLTEIGRDFPGDAFFPVFDRTAFRETSRQRQRTPDGLTYDFVDYQRRLEQGRQGSPVTPSRSEQGNQGSPVTPS
jgi:dihydrofolate reductase